MSELLPCPFCGSTDLKMPEWHTFVLCNDCGAETRGNDGGLEGVEAAIAEWNRRAPSDAAQAPEAWSVYNGVCLDQIFMLRESADKYAANMQKSHDLSGLLAAFVVKPLYAAPVAPQAAMHWTPEMIAAVHKDAERLHAKLKPGKQWVDPEEAQPDEHASTIDRIREALPEFHQQDDYLLAHGASIMSESSHEIIHVDTVRRIVDAVRAAERASNEISVDRGALQAAINMLKHDAEEGRHARGELADELSRATHPTK